MKKAIALVLSLVMLFSVCSVSVAAAEGEKLDKTPIIFIAGSSVDICDAEGNEISTGFDVLTDDEEGEMSTEDIIEAAMNIIKPFILEGLPFDKWDNYGKALYEELAPIWDETQLDGNGNAKYGTGVAQSEIDYWDNRAATVNTGKNRNFKVDDYKFRYDWRLSPYDHVDRLHEYIKTVIKTTKCSQVALVGRCIGGSIITAYLEKYGDEGLVKKVFYDEILSNGSSVISDCFSGKIKFSDKHAQAYLLESKYFGEKGVGIDLAGIDNLVIQLIEDTLEYITQAGITSNILGGVEALYERLYEVFMPSMLLATGVGTWLNYWVCVYESDMDNAINLVFGEESSETRTMYAGLIKKIEYIREHITKVTPGLYKKFAEEYGVEVGILASYGLANAPITEHYDETGDVLVGVQDASFGATASGLFQPLSKEYIDKRVAEGYGEYISPDGRIDASTCLFPETTWFIKNKHHDYGSAYVYLAEYFTQYSNVTVTDNERNVPRFLVHDDSVGRQFSVMTEDNMADGPWITEVEQTPTVKTVFSSFLQFMKTLFAVLKEFFSGLFNKAE